MVDNLISAERRLRPEPGEPVEIVELVEGIKIAERRLRPVIWKLASEVEVR